MHFKELSHLLSTFMCLNCQRMELGAGVLYALLLFSLSCLNTSATPVLNKTIKNCYRLTAELNRSAPVVLQLYLSAQGYPFDNALSKNEACNVDINCLPKGRLENMEEIEMFKKIFIGAQQFKRHLNNTIVQQKNLNPSRKELHDELEYIQTQLTSLETNLQSILHIKGSHVPRHLECSIEHSDNLLLQKRQGCAILTNFKRYVAQVLKRFRHLSRNFSHLSIAKP